jgi:hypothetical protein
MALFTLLKGLFPQFSVEMNFKFHPKTTFGVSGEWKQRFVELDASITSISIHTLDNTPDIHPCTSAGV